MFSWQKLPRPFSVLAPMEDVTDTVFRRLIASCGRPDVFYSEFTSTDGMFSPGEDRVIHRLEYTEEERPLIAQIWGNNPEKYLKAARKIAEMGFDGIDINMGCPVSKIVSNGCCSALIDNPTLARELYLAAKEGAGPIPVSIKTRLGFKKIQTEQWAEFVLSLEPDALIMHGRVAKEMSKKPANWEQIAKVVELRNQAGIDTVVIGNGDVKSLAQIKSYSEQYGVDGVMVGRGIFENPYLFNEHAPHFSEMSKKEKMDLLRYHILLYEKQWSGKKPFRVLKKYFKIYACHFAGASELRMRLVETESVADALELIDSVSLTESIASSSTAP